MGELTPLTRDLSIFNKLELDKPPVGVKFLFGEPEGLPRLERTLGLCEMVTEAQTGKAFYAGFADHECAGLVPLGMMDVDPYYWSGQIGPCLEVFKEARANRRIYDAIPTLERGTGLTFGHIAREVGTEGNVTVSVPWDALPTMVENLKEMPFVLPAYEDGRDNYSERFKRVTGH